MVSSPWSTGRKNPVICSGGGVSRHNFNSPIAWRGCAYVRRCSCCAAPLDRACVVCEVLAAHILAEQSGSLLSVCGHTGLANHRRSISADWSYGVLCFSAENSSLPDRGLALVSGNIGSGHRNRSGWRSSDGGPLL